MTIRCLFFIIKIPLPENYTKPSSVSNWIQKYLPRANNPAPEIFAERYGGSGEGPKLWQALAVAGPDCHKLLIINHSSKGGNTVLFRKECRFSNKNLSAIINKHLDDGSWSGNKINPMSLQLSANEIQWPFYVSLSPEDYKQSIFVPK